MNTNTGGGFLAGVGRMFGGGSPFITDFTARGNGHVAFAAEQLEYALRLGLAGNHRRIDLPRLQHIGSEMVGRLANQHTRAITIAITVGITGLGIITDGDRGDLRRFFRRQGRF